MEGGVSHVDWLDAEGRAKVREPIGQICAGGERGEAEFLATRRDGSRLPILMAATPVTVNETFLGVRGILVDMTEQRRPADARKETLRRMELLNSITRRDISNKLTALLGPLALARAPEPGARREGLDRAERAVSPVLALVAFIGNIRRSGPTPPGGSLSDRWLTGSARPS